MSGEKNLTDDKPVGGKPIKPVQLVSDGVDGVRTTRMLERAIRQRWPITDEQRQAIIDRQIAIASRKTGKAREQSIAAKTVAAFDKLNLEEAKLDEAKVENHLHLHGQQVVPHSKIFFDLPPVTEKAISAEQVKQVSSDDVS